MSGIGSTSLPVTSSPVDSSPASKPDCTTKYPPPAGLQQVEAEFKAWVTSARPELEDDLFGSPNLFGIEMSKETGELRMQLLEEFMASRG